MISVGGGPLSTIPCGVFCYVCMPFGLKNAGATFQRLMRIALGAQMGRNAEAYVDDIVVKTREEDTLIKDLEETFANLRKVNSQEEENSWLFGVPSKTRVSSLYIGGDNASRPSDGWPLDPMALGHL